MSPSSRVPILVAAVSVMAACSTGDGRDLDARVPASTVPATAPAGSGTASDASEVPADSSLLTLPPEPLDPVDSAAVAPSVAEVPEVGVPGLDDDDAFCSAWSRFAGSFQVVAVNAAFGDGSAESVATLEVLAAGTVEQAYDELGERWPPELEAERAAALEEWLGPFARRVGSITEILVALGVGADEQAMIDAAWIEALARRDPNDPELAVQLDDDLAVVADAAATEHLAETGSWFDDDSLVTTAETPLTDLYLATNCPDQGTLAGQDAEG